MKKIEAWENSKVESGIHVQNGVVDLHHSNKMPAAPDQS